MVGPLAASLLLLLAPAPAPEATATATGPVEAASQEHLVLLAFSVVDLAKSDLEALDIGPPEPGEVRIAPTRLDDAQVSLAISALEENGRARLISHPMVMVEAGELAEIESGVAEGERVPLLRLRMRPQVAPAATITSDVRLDLTSGDQTTTMSHDALELPATLVRCDDADRCLLLVAHARLQH